MSLIDDWIAALRSGKYTQCRQRLRDNGSFCCLGVLCEVSPDTHHVGGGYDINVDGHMVPESIDLGPSALRQFGFRSLVKIEDLMGYPVRPGVNIDLTPNNILTWLNDHGKWTFEQIADFVDKNRHVLFEEVACTTEQK